MGEPFRPGRRILPWQVEELPQREACFTVVDVLEAVPSPGGVLEEYGVNVKGVNVE